MLLNMHTTEQTEQRITQWSRTELKQKHIHDYRKLRETKNNTATLSISMYVKTIHDQLASELSSWLRAELKLSGRIITGYTILEEYFQKSDLLENIHMI